MNRMITDPYVFFYYAGFAVAVGAAILGARQRSLPLLPWLALLVACAAGGIAGSKLIFFDLHVPAAGEKTILGGLAGGMLALLVAQRWIRMDRPVTPLLAPAALLGAAVGRVGCFLVGCCFGSPTALPWGVAYGPGTPAFREQVVAGQIPADAIATLHVHPSQLYEAAAALLLAAALARWGGALRARGSAALALIVGYAAARWANEFARGGGPTDAVLGFTVAQWSLTFVGAAALAALLLREASAGRAVTAEVATPTPGRVGDELRSAAVVVGVGAAALLDPGWLLPLERSVLAAMVATAVVVPIAAHLRTRRWRPASGIAVITALPLLLPASGADTIALFPYDYYTLGASGDAGRFRTVVELEPGNSCAGYETREYAFRALGVSAAYTRVTSPDESYTARVRGFMGRQQLRRVDGMPVDREDPISGVAAIGAYDGRGWGVAGGVLAGERVDDYGRQRSGPLPVAGIRGGQLDGFFGEIRLNDQEAAPFPRKQYRVNFGYGWGERGAALRVGATEAGLFGSVRLVTQGGLEIEPLGGLGEGGFPHGGISVRQRFGWRPGTPPN
jgi:prolipoprotein diacylglyceryltransferase